MDAGAIVDLSVSVADQSVLTNADGVVRVRLQAGKHAVCFRKSFEQTVSCVDVLFAAGQTSLLLLTLGDDGRVVSSATEVPRTELLEVSAQDNETVERFEQRIKVLSEASGEPVSKARVFVVGQDVELVTNKLGEAVVNLPVGRYTFSVIHTRYSTTMKRDVSIGPDAAQPLVIKLGDLSLSLDDFVVTIPRITGSVAKVLEDRRKSSSVQDGLGAEELSRSPDGSASSASRRIVGASVIGGQFLVVRGLGGRYTNVRLNNVPLPSTDPDMPGVQMDLFPSSLLSSLTIEKTFSAHLPANFAGGTMNIETKAFPEEFTLNLSLSTGWNSVSTFQSGYTYPGSDTDWLGFDDGRRRLPSRVPNRRVTGVGLRGLPYEEVAEIGKSFEPNWETQNHRVRPPLSLGFSVGDTVKNSGWTYGYLVTGGYKYNETLARETRQTFNLQGAEGEQSIEVRERMHQTVTGRSALVGGLASLSVKTPQNDTYKFVSVLTQTMNDEASVMTGKQEQEDANVRLTQLQFIERRLWLNQLLGAHPELLQGLQVDWRLNLSNAARAQPDTRSLLYIQRTADQPFFYRDTTGSGERLFSELDQVDYGAALDLTYTPERFADSALTLKSGFAASKGERNFTARRFGVRYVGTVEDRELDPNELFQTETFGDRFQFRELTRPDDGYQANLSLLSAYLSVDVTFMERVRSIVGVRVEDSEQGIVAASPYANEEQQQPDGDKTYFDPLPSAALVFLISDVQSLRLAYGGTVARPLVREFAPFLSQDFVRGIGVQGNPDLRRTYIHNYDLRWENFFSTTEVMAVSAFYKSFLHPIERVIIDTNGNIRYSNVEGATNYGLELELRVNLGRLTDDLSQFELGSNLALIKSNVALSDEQKAVADLFKSPARKSESVCRESFTRI